MPQPVLARQATAPTSVETEEIMDTEVITEVIEVEVEREVGEMIVEIVSAI